MIKKDNSFKRFAELNSEILPLRKRILEINAEKWECVKKARKYLNPKQYKILKMLTYEGKSLAEVAKQYGVTRTRIRNIMGTIIGKWSLYSSGQYHESL